MDNDSTNKKLLLSHSGVPYHCCASDSDAQKAIVESLQKSSLTPWKTFLENSPTIDGFNDLRTSSEFCRALGKSRLLSTDFFMLRVSDFYHKLNQRRYRSNNEEKKTALKILYLTWHRFILKLNRRISSIRPIPDNGVFIHFNEGLDCCTVFKYMIVGMASEIEPVSVIPKPMCLYDIWSLVENVPQEVRAYLKEFLTLGLKIVAHRNSMVCVDRRVDAGVFGPSIDTLYLNEMLYKYLYDFPNVLKVKNMIEIGCGNGLLTVSFLGNCDVSDEALALDASLNAVNCTYKNTTFIVNYRKKNKCSYLCGYFNPDFSKKKFDIILCNPPYIPLPPDHTHKEQGTTGPLSPTAGTSLMTNVLRNSEKILSNSGILFMVYSSVAMNDFKNAIPQTMEVINVGNPDGFQVLFDIEDVLGNKKWLKYLQEIRGIKRVGRNWYHTLYCAAIHKRLGFKDKNGTLDRIMKLNSRMSVELERMKGGI